MLLSGNGARVAVAELARQFEQKTGRTVTVTFAVNPEVQRRIEGRASRAASQFSTAPVLHADRATEGRRRQPRASSAAAAASAPGMREGAPRPASPPPTRSNAPSMRNSSPIRARAPGAEMRSSSLIDRLGLSGQLKARCGRCPASTTWRSSPRRAEYVVVVASDHRREGRSADRPRFPQELQTWIGFTGGVCGTARRSPGRAICCGSSRRLPPPGCSRPRESSPRRGVSRAVGYHTRSVSVIGSLLRAARTRQYPPAHPLLSVCVGRRRVPAPGAERDHHYAVATPLSIDGTLDEAFYRTATSQRLTASALEPQLTARRPPKGPRLGRLRSGHGPPVRSAAGKATAWAKVVAESAPHAITRPFWGGDDVVIFYLDPFNDGRNGFSSS